MIGSTLPRCVVLCDNLEMQSVNLTHHFLIAMPNMQDPHFAGTLVYICEHTDQGALGLIVNRPVELDVQSLYEQVDIAFDRPDIGPQTCYFGGPVQMDRGFVLHRPVGEWTSTIAMNGNMALTTSKDILHAIAEGKGPEQFIISLGYAGWEGGQLEQELAQNAWLTVPASPDIIFELDPEARVEAAMHCLGVDRVSLSDQAGHA